MTDEQLELPLEVFDRKIKWPKGNDKMRAEELSHPGIIPDTPEGPFKDWIKEKVEDENEEDVENRPPWRDDELEGLKEEGSWGEKDEEIGYEGER